MKFLRLESTNPYYNLAVEEYIFKNFTDDVFILWQNEPCVVIGKNQNAYAEINLEHIKNKNIKIVRRITGGGAVYHDLGNLNYTFISSERGSIDFAYFTRPIISALEALGVKAHLSGRNDLEAEDGRKISGNAQRAELGRVLHHGTLLFNSDISALGAALKVDKAKLHSKSVRSVQSRVANISEYIEGEVSIGEFIDFIKEQLMLTYNPEIIDAPSAPEIEELTLRNASDEWLFPSGDYLSIYNINRKKRFDFGTVECNLSLKKDVIQGIRIFGDFFEVGSISELEDKLSGSSLLTLENFRIGVENYILGMCDAELCDLLIGRE